AQKCGAVEMNGEIVTLVNWRVYQDKAYKTKILSSLESGETLANSATHPSPFTGQGSANADPRSPIAPLAGEDSAQLGESRVSPYRARTRPRRSRLAYSDEFEGFWAAYPCKRNKAAAAKAYRAAI